MREAREALGCGQRGPGRGCGHCAPQGSADHEPLPTQVPEPTGPGSAIPLSAGDRVAVPRYEAGREGGTRILMEQAK